VVTASIKLCSALVQSLFNCIVCVCVCVCVWKGECGYTALTACYSINNQEMITLKLYMEMDTTLPILIS